MTLRTYILNLYKQTAFLTVLFVSGLGMILYTNGEVIRQANDNDADVPGWFALEFAGAFLAILFWVSAALRSGACLHLLYTLLSVDARLLFLFRLQSWFSGSSMTLR